MLNVKSNDRTECDVQRVFYFRICVNKTELKLNLRNMKLFFLRDYYIYVENLKISYYNKCIKSTKNHF